MYAIPNTFPKHWPELLQADLFQQENGEIVTRTGARSATARGSISPFFAPESKASFFVRGRSSTAYQSTHVDSDQKNRD